MPPHLSDKHSFEFREYSSGAQKYDTCRIAAAFSQKQLCQKNHTMKTGIAALGIFFALTASGQNIQYKKILDNPADVSNFYVNLELLQTELPLNNITGTSFALGISPYVCYNNRFGAEATFRRGWLNLAGVPRVNFELGGFCNFKQRTKERNQRVILDQNKYTSGSMEYTETKFIRVPAQNMRSLGLRAGFLTNQEVYKAEDGSITGTHAYKWTGIYAGIQLTSQMNMRINTDLFGEAGAGFIRRYYADVTIHPIASLRDTETDAKSGASIGRIGARVGLIAMPAERRKIQTPVYLRGEIGVRPLDGPFMNVAFGVNFKRKINKLGVQEAGRETE
jgi:hypothetical protein